MLFNSAISHAQDLFKDMSWSLIELCKGLLWNKSSLVIENNTNGKIKPRLIGERQILKQSKLTN